MGFIYIILSVLCRLLPLGTLSGIARCLRCVSSSSVTGENDADVYAVWLPAGGWWTVWTARNESERESHCEIVRVQRGLPTGQVMVTRTKTLRRSLLN